MAVMRARQFGAKVEGAEGVAETLGAGDFAVNIKDVGAEHDHPEYTRDLVRGSATKQPNLKGTRRLRITGTLECCGGTASTQAVWHQILRACGFARTGLVVISVGAPTGAGASAYSIGTIVGDNAARASATKTARVVRWIGGSPNRIVLEPITGTFASADVIHAYNGAGTSVATATASTGTSAAGHAFVPTTENDSFVPESLTAEVRLSEQIHRAVGCRGNATFQLRHGEPLQLECELEGLSVVDANQAPLTGGRVTNVPALPIAPRVAKGFTFLLDGMSPVATQLTVALNNTLAQRATIGTGVGSAADSGYLPPRITDRNVTISCDPEQPPVATAEWYGRSLRGETFPMYIEVGLPNDGNGMVVLYAPAVQLTGNQAPADRDGYVIRNLEGMATGDVDDELRIYHVFA